MAGMNVNQESIQEMLTCAICMEEFRSPRSLPCLHTFCQTCLGDYLVRKHVRPGSSFACPTCRETVVLPQQGVVGLRSNFLITSMLGLLETKEEVREQDAFTEDLMNLEDVADGEASGCQVEEEEKNKRISQTQLLMYQAKEEKLKSTLVKAERHADTLKDYNTRVGTTINEITNLKEKLLEKIRERLNLIKEEVAKYETELLEQVQREIDVEKESKPFQEEAAFVDEDLAALQNIAKFAEDVLSSGSLETVAAITDEVVKNVNKIVKRELKQLDWKSYDLEIPELDTKEQTRSVIGSLKEATVVSDGSQIVPANDDRESSPIPIPELEEEPAVRKAKVSTASSSSPTAAVHADIDEIRVYPRYLADEFLVATPGEQETVSSSSDMWRGSPLALAGFDDDASYNANSHNPPIPPRSFESDPSVPNSSPAQTRSEASRPVKREKELVMRNNDAGSNADSQRRHHRAAVKKKSPAKIFRLTLKLPPAVITANLIGTLPTPLDTIHDIAITSERDICVLGLSSTRDAIYQSIAIFKSTGAQKAWKRLHPFEPSYPGLTSFATLTYKGQESVALPLPEDSRIRIIPIDNPPNLEPVRTIFHKFKNMLYRPFHVCNFNEKLWAFGLDSFGRDSYDTKSKFDEWHPQCRVWDIESAETTEGPVKSEAVLVPCATPPSYATVEPSSSTMYICERETVSAVRLTDKGSLLWKFGETAKKKQKLKQAQGLCVDTSSGRIFVACQGGDKIVALSTDGQFLQTVLSDKQGIKKPTAVALDAAGQLIVGQANGHIKVYAMST